MASFPQASPPTPCAPLYPPPIRATCPAHLIRLDFTTRTILGKEYRSFSSSLCSYVAYYFQRSTSCAFKYHEPPGRCNVHRAYLYVCTDMCELKEMSSLLALKSSCFFFFLFVLCPLISKSASQHHNFRPITTHRLCLTPIPTAARSKAWVCGRSLACWECGIESRRVHGCLSVLSVTCCQVEVSAAS